MGFKWPGNVSNQSTPGELSTEVYVKFLDHNVGWLSKVPVASGKHDVVPIEAISVRLYGKEAQSYREHRFLWFCVGQQRSTKYKDCHLIQQSWILENMCSNLVWPM